MADNPYTITAATLLQSGAQGTPYTSGEAMDAGTLVYLDTGNSSVAKKADHTASLNATVKGITLNTSEITGQPVAVAASGEITVQNGAFASVGILLVLSGTAGKMMDAGNLAAGDYVTIVGVTTATNKFMLLIQNTGVVKT